MCTFKSFVLCSVAVIACCLVHSSMSENLLRPKRFLIFPRQAPTRFQFIGGIGIPADLSYESLVSGYVLKAEFYLPYNATVFRENPFFPEYQNVLKDRGRQLYKLMHTPSELRWHIYEFLMNRFHSFGYNGEECLFKTICEANAIPFERNHNLFAEIIHILFSPSSSTNAARSDAINFKEAEKVGRTKGDCNIYACNVSLINWISHVVNNKF